MQLRDLVVENNLQKSLRSSIQSELEDKNKIISLKDAIIDGKESEIEAMATAMKEKDTISSEICGQLANVRKYLATEKQVNAIQVTVIIRFSYGFSPRSGDFSPPLTENVMYDNLELAYFGT